MHTISLEAEVVWPKVSTYIFETQTNVNTEPTKDVYIKHVFFTAFLQIFICFSVFEKRVWLNLIQIWPVDIK